MRSPVIAFSIFAAAVSPSLVSAVPTPKSPSLNNKSLDNVGASATRMIPRQVPGVPVSVPAVPGVPIGPGAAPANSNGNGTSNNKKNGRHDKRAWDWGTAGGNAYTGSTGNTGGGSIVNDANGSENTEGGGIIMNGAGTSE